MCGIAGTWGIAERAVIERMTAALAHRGPDDAGILVDCRCEVMLGHRRLSVIDPSSLGHQPMPGGAGRYRMVYNGEIYNFRELRTELEGLGHRFTSGTDSEVVLAAYAQWGPASVERLRGMFAYAIWDSGRVDGARVAPGHLFLARDRFGIKPLLYSYADGRLVFASELKSLLASGLVDRTISRQAVWDYLSLGAVPQPRTMVAAVQALPAGHWMRVESGVAPSPVRYWDIAAAHPRAAVPADRAEAVTEIRRLLDDAARSHMIADVPVGAFLSGGIDSTAVVGLMSQFVSRPIRTYSIGFDSKYGRYNELSWARIAAERFGTDHTEVIITEAMLRQEYDNLIRAVDQPSLDGTNSYFVSQAARSGVTVSLSGLGGDELFAGYGHFRRFARAQRLLPRGARGIGSFHRLDGVVPRRLTGALDFCRLSPVERHATVRRLLRDEEKLKVASPAFQRGGDVADLAEFYARVRPDLDDAVAEMSYVELNGYLANTLLRDVDAMSMAHALEVRPVLLDAPLAEFVFSLPGKWKLDRRAPKPLLCDALGDLLPPSIASRPKMGFEFPLSAWLTGAVRERALDALRSPAAASIFAEEFLRQSCEEVRAARVTGNRLWAYVILIDWMRQTGCTVSDA